MNNADAFLFATCQVGAEVALKRELARLWPGTRPAFARPGFVTFKAAAGLPAKLFEGVCPVFARVFGRSLGPLEGATATRRIDALASACQQLRPCALHVFSRDLRKAGWRGFEPGIDEAARMLAAEIGTRQFSNAAANLPAANAALRMQPTGKRALIADLVLVDPGLWWLGCHETACVQTTWPGGFFPEELPAQAVSRAYLKMKEALAWAAFKIRPGQCCVEIGSAPGGSSQALLELGLDVVGIDPAEMHVAVLGNARFRHIRRRAKEVRRREFLGVDWLTCDVNMPPNYALDAIDAIVSYPGVSLKGLIVTLKLLKWPLAEKVPAWLERFRKWGFRNVRARQLHHDRQEICVAAQ